MHRMSETAPSIDCYRRRWEKARAPLRSLDPEDEQFATGRLGKQVLDLALRVMIFPGDPAVGTIEFDSGYWEWWQTPRLDPFRDGQTNFGSTHRPSSVAAVQFDEGYDRQGRSSWRRFIALHRSGAMEAGFGGDVASEDGERRVFELIAMVGRIWSLLARYSDVVARYGCAGPFEVSIALLGTSDAPLGNVGAGWADAIRSFLRSGVSLPRTERPDTAGARGLARQR